MTRITLAACVSLFLFPASPSTGESISTLTLDGLSYVSFDEEQILPLPSGSTIRFHFGDPHVDGSLPFTIAPADVEIGPIPLGSGRDLTYGMGSQASGSMHQTAEGWRIHFTAAITATLTGGSQEGTFTYSVPFTTETVSATNHAGTNSVQVSGVRLIDGAWYGQIVGATVNKDNAFPNPGAAVYTILSGTFDQLPDHE